MIERYSDEAIAEEPLLSRELAEALLRDALTARTNWGNDARALIDLTIDRAIAAVDKRRLATHWAGDARLLRLVMADLEALRVQSPHDPEG